MSIRLITRADDFGSCHAADQAILAALRAGVLIRNVSCMAVGATIKESAASLLPFAGQVDIGLHFVLNSEWDSVKWTPCAPHSRIQSLLTQQGEFFQTREELLAAAPEWPVIETELNAQLERLTALGLPVSYVDGHMAPDGLLPGLAEHMSVWAQSRGLLYVRDHSRFPSCGMPAFAPSEAAYQSNVEHWLTAMEPGAQYLYFLHPARMCDETILFCNGEFAPGVVAWERELEARSAVSPVWNERIARYGLKPVRYRDAQPSPPLPMGGYF